MSTEVGFMPLERVSVVLKSKAKITLIIGPSCSGKSTYINTMYKNHENVFMGHELVDNPLPKGSVTVHYNSFRPYKNSFKNIHRDFLSDPALRKIIATKIGIKAILLFCSKKTLLKRALTRKFSEPILRKSKNLYPKDKVINLLNNIDLDKHYEEWCAFLDKHNIVTTYIDSNDRFFVELSKSQQKST